MEVLFLQQHFDEALACLQRRRDLLAGTTSCYEQVLCEERRLIWLMHTLTKVDVEPGKPVNADEVQLYCMRLLLSNNFGQLLPRFGEIMEFFSHGFESAEGALAALQLASERLSRRCRATIATAGGRHWQAH